MKGDGVLPPPRAVAETALTRITVAHRPCDFGPVEVKRYQCPVCDQVYATFDHAAECAGRGIQYTDVKPGDVVLCGRSRFGWYNGDPAWVAECTHPNPNRFPRDGGGHQLSLYYVVGSVTLKKASHAEIAHLFTEAFRPHGDNAGYSAGVTGPGHMTMHRLDPAAVPAAIAAAIPKYLGQVVPENRLL